ncbi:MAG: phosphoenolpyruvate carboxykinase (ATP) [Tissierellia bacterium]|nr:phosphoenolpyruvate carboxykinase (ATP) [Tissierellia bacterium]
MASIERFKESEISINNPIFSSLRATVETAFYRNNVVEVNSIAEAYELAYNSSGTIVTDMPVYEPEKLGLPKDSKILLFNDGAITGRYAKARVILGDEGVDTKEFLSIAREAEYHSRYKKMYHAQAYIGLDPHFMVKAHLLIPEGHENILYSWMLNFQNRNSEYDDMYKGSAKYEEGDIYFFSNPDYIPSERNDGLALFDSTHNCAMIMGLRYFGEHKKGTLTLAWGFANRNGYASCHGGLKRYKMEDKSYTVGVFGLSGSGKSTLTHARHDGQYDITILHDDAYVISTEDGSSVALEPSYFDKTQDYPTADPSNKYLLTVQNCGATVTDEGKVVVVTEDIRNGNGRAVKSKLWTENRVNYVDSPVDSIIWLMKDATIPPVLKLSDPVLAAVFGATLATKRTTAERLAKGVDINALVIEPYANPFRTYPLKDDYDKFHYLFANRNVSCYILNTGHFIEKKIPKEITLGILESLVEDKGEFIPFGPFENVSYLPQEGFDHEFDDDYKEMWIESLKNRADFLERVKTEEGGKNALPDEALEAIKKMMDSLK